jgi:hypothetical protein
MMGDSGVETGAPFPGSGSWKGTIFGTFSRFTFMQENQTANAIAKLERIRSRNLR